MPNFNKIRGPFDDSICNSGNINITLKDQCIQTQFSTFHEFFKNQLSTNGCFFSFTKCEGQFIKAFYFSHTTCTHIVAGFYNQRQRKVFDGFTAFFQGPDRSKIRNRYVFIFQYLTHFDFVGSTFGNFKRNSRQVQSISHCCDGL